MSIERTNILDDEIISGHRMIQSTHAKWLEVESIYQKFYRPNFYDIGGSYLEDVADLWFTYKTDQVGNIFLLHLFVTNRLEGYSNISVPCDNSLSTKKYNSNHPMVLNSALKTYEFDNSSSYTCNFVTTYSFSEVDVELLKNKKLFIPIKLQNKASNASDDVQPHDYKSLLDDPVCSDFVVESEDGVKFNVHKVILSASSEVFKAMLKENTVESQNNYLKMVDIPSTDLKLMLEFIYSGTIEDMESCDFSHLIMLGDRYDIKGLRELSELGLKSHLDSSNVFHTLFLADSYNSEQLKLEALKFIKKYKVPLNDAPSSDTIVSFNHLHVSLVRDLCRFLAPYD